MKIIFSSSIAALVFASAIGVAAAADSNAMSKPMAGAAQSAKDSLTLTAKQETTAWNDIRKHATEEKAPSTFTASIGSVVPTNVTLRRIPVNATRQLPELKPYKYALFEDRLLIVNPSDKKVVDVIKHRA